MQQQIFPYRDQLLELSQYPELAHILRMNELNPSLTFVLYSKNPKINLSASKIKPPHTTKRSMSICHMFSQHSVNPNRIMPVESRRLLYIPSTSNFHRR